MKAARACHWMLAMTNRMSFTKLLVLGLALVAGPTSLVLPSVWAAPDDPWDGKRVDPDYQYATPQAYEDFADRKFGMRVHWGQYSVLGLNASGALRRGSCSKEFREIYLTQYQLFNPVQFNADEWAALCSRAGMKYIITTTKHHDGFCLWPTRTTTRALKRVSSHTHVQTKEVEINDSVMDTPFKRDGIAELAAAFRKKGLGFGIHFSHPDWNDYRFRWDFNNRFYDPQYSRKTNPEDWEGWVEQHRKQILELASNYGALMAISFDTGGIPMPEDSFPDIVKTIKMVRQLQPDCLFRNRGIGAYGDFDTPEGSVPGGPRGDRERVWEAIDFIGGAWGWQPGDNYKSREWILGKLIEAVSKGGNCCLNVSPMPNGKFDPEYVSRLEYVGDWLKVNGEAIYKTRSRGGELWKEGNDVRFTRSKDLKTVYAISLAWPGSQLALQSVQPKKGSSIHLLGWARPLPWRAEGNGVVIEMPEKLRAEDSKRPCKQAYAFRINVEPRSNE